MGGVRVKVGVVVTVAVVVGIGVVVIVGIRGVVVGVSRARQDDEARRLMVVRPVYLWQSLSSTEVARYVHSVALVDVMLRLRLYSTSSTVADGGPGPRVVFTKSTWRRGVQLTGRSGPR